MRQGLVIDCTKETKENSRNIPPVKRIGVKRLFVSKPLDGPFPCTVSCQKLHSVGTQIEDEVRKTTNEIVQRLCEP